MAPRYIVQAQTKNNLYRVWDRQTGKVATALEGHEYVDLSFANAFATVAELNEQDSQD